MEILNATIMRGIAKACTYALIAFACMSLLMLCGAVAFQRRIIYPIGFGSDKSPPFLPVGWKEIRTPRDGLDLRSYVHDAGPKAPVAIVLHGNAADPFSMASTASPFVRAGWTVIVPEFPGYADSPGYPDQKGMSASARGAWDHATASGIRPGRIVVIGNSIGSGPAIALAAVERPAGLLIVSGLSSMGRVVRHHLPIIPDLLVMDKWDNGTVIGDVEAPVVVWHGTRDTLIPFEEGRRLASAAGAPLRTAPLGHELFWESSLQDDLLRHATRMIAHRAP